MQHANPEISNLFNSFFISKYDMTGERFRLSSRNCMNVLFSYVNVFFVKTVNQKNILSKVISIQE